MILPFSPEFNLFREFPFFDSGILCKGDIPAKQDKKKQYCFQTAGLACYVSTVNLNEILIP